MFVLEPIFHKTLWGGNRLVPIYGGQAAGLGHLYSLRCKDENSNIILNGKYKGKKIFSIIGGYPLSLALVDAEENLSIQVHPGGNSAKYESYYFIEAPKSESIYCGMNRISPEDIRTAVNKGKLLPYVKQAAVKKGSYIDIEPCTVHALTAGSLVYEIEQGEDITYRLFDYNRVDDNGKERELQVEKAIEILEQPLSGSCQKPYTTKILTNVTEYINVENTCECLTLLSGNVIVEDVPLKIGMTIILEPNDRLERLAIEKCIIARLLI